jgi:hypothetical protein
MVKNALNKINVHPVIIAGIIAMFAGWIGWASLTITSTTAIAGQNEKDVSEVKATAKENTDSIVRSEKERIADMGKINEKLATIEGDIGVIRALLERQNK